MAWSAKRELSKINYRIHTDAIKVNLIPAEVTREQAAMKYADEADVLNGSAFLKFTCRRGNNVYEMVAFGEDRSSILYNLFVDSSSRELNRKIMNAYFAESLRVYNGNVMACINSAFDDISYKEL